ncbi:MAG: hypothetical protein HYZ26_07510, partial [Chloroflexi bacterium]|nr:hypothetical protein [Chloroflexota bacterium]
AGAASYTIQVSRYANLSSPLISVTVTGSAYVSTKDLTPGVTLYWRVRTNGTYGPSVWTETRSFTSPKPPSIPVVVAPKGNVLLTDYTPLFDWSNSSVPSGTSFSHYQIQVARDSGFTDLVHDEQVAGATSSAFTPLADLESNRTYYWRVRAFNASGQYSAWSATGIFRTAMLAPVQRLPEMNATLTTIRPTFDWDAVSGATAYRLQVSTSSTFGTLLINVNVTGTEYTSTVNLPKNTNLYWRVLANGANPSAWSPTWTFIIR